MSMFLLQQREYRQWIILKLFIKYLKSLKNLLINVIKSLM